MTWVPRAPFTGPVGAPGPGGEPVGPETGGLGGTPAAGGRGVKGGSIGVPGVNPGAYVEDAAGGDAGIGRFQFADGTPTMAGDPITLDAGGPTTVHPGIMPGDPGVAPRVGVGPVYAPSDAAFHHADRAVASSGMFALGAPGDRGLGPSLGTTVHGLGLASTILLPAVEGLGEGDIPIGEAIKVTDQQVKKLARRMVRIQVLQGDLELLAAKLVAEYPSLTHYPYGLLTVMAGILEALKNELADLQERMNRADERLQNLKDRQARGQQWAGR